MTFSDVINFKYDDAAVDKDIRHLLRTGQFKPAYADAVREFMAAEIANCQKTINDEHYHLTVLPQGPMCEDVLKRDPRDINPILDRLNFDPVRRDFWYNYFVNPKYGRQKHPPLLRLKNGDKTELMSVFGLVTDAFYSIYTEIHELMHACQDKFMADPEKDKRDLRLYELLYTGISLDAAHDAMAENNPDLRAEKHARRCFIEMQANSAGACYMMLQAVRSGDASLVAAVEKRLKNEAASMSGALMNENLGLAYFEYPATKKIIEEVKSGKCANLLNPDGLLDWRALFEYTKRKIAEMGYDARAMSESKKTAVILKDLKAKHPNDKTAFLAAVESVAPTLAHPHNKICLDFVAAQRDYTPDNSKNLHNFYHRIGAPSFRESALEKATPETVPHIDEYRNIYAAAKCATLQNGAER